MWAHKSFTHAEVRSKIRKGDLNLAGNSRLKIYGLLNCASGRRMKRQNRVFFVSEMEALENCYRPCGHCLREKYQAWIYSTQHR
jgi:methylphosphotriester-DNA--protein-cysteine methyltransferase